MSAPAEPTRLHALGATLMAAGSLLILVFIAVVIAVAAGWIG